MYCPGVEVLLWGGCYVLSWCGGSVVERLLYIVLLQVWLIACFFIQHWVAVCGRSVCDLIIACGVGEREMCDNSLSDNRGVLDMCVKYYEEIMRMFCTYLCLVFLCNFISGCGVSSTGGIACLPHF